MDPFIPATDLRMTASRRAWFAVLFLFASAGLLVVRAQEMRETVGRLSGDDVEVADAASMTTDLGRTTATLASGSNVTVRSGQALVELAEGGSVAVCGPARFSVLKSGGSVTLALDYGRIHPRVNPDIALSVFTPLIVATPLAIGRGKRDLTIGLTREGAMCAFAASGAVRLEQQFSGQSLLVPQGGEISLAGGQLSALHNSGASSACTCELTVTETRGPRQTEVSFPVRPSAPPPAPPPAPPAATEEPIYQVYMPPLMFDASSPLPPPEPDPQTIVLVREARLRPTVVFQGRVEAAVASEPRTDPVPARLSDDAPQPRKPGFFARLLGIFIGRRGGGSAPCAGVGCGSSSN